MADFTPVDYAVSTEKWRIYFGVPDWVTQDDKRAEIIKDKIEPLREQDPAKYAEFMSDARAWAVREGIRLLESNEKNAPITPLDSGRSYENGEYIVLGMSTAGGVFESAMELAYSTGDIIIGFIIAADSNTKWRYEIKCVTYDANGLTPGKFLEGANKNAPIRNNVNSEVVERLSTSGIAYRKKGTCNIRLEYVADTNVKASDSPQYNDGSLRASFSDISANETKSN